MNKPLVSVITLTYNQDKYIRACLESVQKQSYPHWEQIIVDDGSQDGTVQILHHFARLESRLKLICHEKNWGLQALAESYNQAFECARGEIIAILEGDDFWPHDKLEKQVTCFESKSTVLSWGKTAFTDEEGNILGFRPRKKPRLEVSSNRPPGQILTQLLYRSVIPAVSVLMRRESLASIGGFSASRYFVDYPTFLRMSLEGEFCYVDSLVGYWRRHRAQSTAELHEDFALAASDAAQQFVQTIPVHLREKYRYSLEKIQRKERTRITFSYLFEARMCLARGAWSEARSCFKKVLRTGSIFWKWFSIVGWLCAFYPLRSLFFRKARKW
jgi:glycosyltransferase involved in cell wall biosynthesis